MAMGTSQDRRLRLKETLGSEDLCWLVDRLRSRLELGRPLEGVVSLSQATPSQRGAVDRLLGRSPSIGTSLSVNLGHLEAILCRAELCSSLSEAVESLIGPVTNRSAELEGEKDRWRHVFGRQQSGLEERWHPWLLALQSSGLLRRLSNNNPIAAESLLSQAIAVLKLLPCHGIPLAELAATAIGNSHALDAGQPVATLLIRAIGLPDQVEAADDAPRARAKARAAARREAWASVGVMLDELSSPVLVLNLRADQESLTGRSLNLHFEVGEPFRLSVRQLLRHTPSFKPGRASSPVFVCENPTVVAAAAHRLGAKSAPLICTDGQPKTAATLLLTQLASAGFRLAYHGDFDWPGIQIGNLIMQRHGAMPWRFEAAHYLAHRGRFALKGQPVVPSWDARLMQEMIRVGHAVHEEQVLDDLLSDLSNRSQS